MKIDDECEFTYTTFKKKGKSYVFSNDKTIIKTCLDFLKFNFNKEFMVIEESNKITETLKVCDFVPCLFSDTIKTSQITSDSCDCMGFVTQVPSAETNYRYVNLVDGKLYKYAVLFHFDIVDGSTVP